MDNQRLVLRPGWNRYDDNAQGQEDDRCPTLGAQGSTEEEDAEDGSGEDLDGLVSLEYFRMRKIEPWLLTIP